MLLEQAVEEYDYDALNMPPRFEITKEQVEALVNELNKYHEIYGPYFGNESQIEYSHKYISGLLNPEITRKSVENIALATQETELVRPLQYFIGVSRWSDTGLIMEHRRQMGVELGESDGIIILDGSDFPKQGDHSVGVQRQRCGELGKVANCQAGVFLGYSSGKGYTLLDKRLYIPEKWFTKEYTEDRYKCHVPANLAFQTKNRLAWTMIEEVVLAGTLPARWITMDEAFGRDTVLLDRIDSETDYYYFAELPKDTRLWLEKPNTYLPQPSGRGRPAIHRRLVDTAPAAQTVAEIATQLAADEWETHSLRDGEQGLMIAQLAALRIYPVRRGLPGEQCWLIIRRNPSNPTEIHYFFSNAPADITLDELAYVCSMRWPIETIFQQAKQLLGMNEYETRTWFGWHHHMAHVILAFGFLACTQSIFKTDAPAITLPQVVDLLKAVLPKPLFDAEAAIALVIYKEKRIASAKKSHYKMQKRRVIDPFLVTQ